MILLEQAGLDACAPFQPDRFWVRQRVSLENRTGSEPRYPKPPPACPLMICPPATAIPGQNALQPPPRTLSPVPPRALLTGSRKGKGGRQRAHGGRATTPRLRALQSPGTPEEPGRAGPSRRPQPSPREGPDSAGLPSPGGPRHRESRKGAGRRGPGPSRRVPAGPAAYPAPCPVRRPPRPPEAPRCARPIRRHRDGSAAPAAPAARPGPALLQSQALLLALASLGPRPRPCSRPQALLPAPALSRG